MNATAKILSVLGRFVHRADGIEKVTGRTKHTGDVANSGMVEGKFLRNPYTQARIRSILAAGAETMPGVVAVPTRADFTDSCPYIGCG